MEPETKLATHIEINEEKDSESSQQRITAQCRCGKQMETIRKDESGKNGRKRCSQCHFHFSSDQPFPYFYACEYCPKFNLCQKCGEYSSKLHTKPVKDMHDIRKLYYVYTDQIIGPYTVDQVIKLYVDRKFKNRIYVQNASSYEDNWIKLVLPEFHRESLQKLDPKRCDMMTECEIINELCRKKYPELYHNFIEAIFTGKVQKVMIPKNIPIEVQQTFYVQDIVIRYIGKILLLFVIIIIILHCILTCFMVIIYWCIRIFVRDIWNISFERDWYLYYMSIVVSSLGIFITPTILVFVIIRYTNMWNEVQSWMISYIIWGILTFITTSVIPYLQQKKKTKIVKKLMHILFYIIGVDFGEHGFWTVTGAYKHGQNEEYLLLAFSYAFFSLSALLPAAIGGFIANFILEEKFILKCGNDEFKDVCFASKDECCEIVSSHDSTNFYEFIGGLTTNLIATWAALQIVGYLLLNAFPVFTIYAKRK